MKRFHLIVSGVVQGVGFRYYSSKEAQRHSLTGFVRNRSDGAVEIEVQGTPEAVERFVEWTNKGPRSAIVESVQKNEITVFTGEKIFEIR